MLEQQDISARRINLALKALRELPEILPVLRQHIAEHDNSGQIAPLARGLLDRIGHVSSVVFDCIGGLDKDDPGYVPDDKLAERVHSGIVCAWEREDISD